MSTFQENIHIAILGPVSAGKSTLLNGIFMNHFSDMNRYTMSAFVNGYLYQTDSASISLSPTTRIYGTFILLCSRIFLANST